MVKKSISKKSGSGYFTKDKNFLKKKDLNCHGKAKGWVLLM